MKDTRSAAQFGLAFSLDPHDLQTLSSTQDAEERLAARHELLASIPLPSDTPGDVLSPLNVPSSVTLRDFLNSTNGVRALLSDFHFDVSLTFLLSH